MNVISLNDYKEDKNRKKQVEYDEFVEGLDFMAVMRHLTGKEENPEKVRAFLKSMEYMKETEEEKEYLLQLLEEQYKKEKSPTQ